jgi:gamma-glutamyl hercynylcysteine S-oxide synthase
VALMSKMKAMTATPLASYSHEWKYVPQAIVPIQATKAASGPPAGMVKIPEGDFLFKVAGIEIEGFNDVGWMYSIPGKIHRDAFTNSPCT